MSQMAKGGGYVIGSPKKLLKGKGNIQDLKPDIKNIKAKENRLI